MKMPLVNDSISLSLSTEIKRALLSAASSGDNTLVAAVTGKQIIVMSMVIVLGAAETTLIFKSGGTALTGSMVFVDNSGPNLGYSPMGHLETSEGEALVLNLSGANTTGGFLTYIEI